MVFDSDLVYIYGLSDPRTGGIHYIGKSIDLEARLYAHTRDKKSTAKTRWIKELKREGMEPELKILEVVAEAYWQECEKKWIIEGKERGWPLTNVNHGGGGGASAKAMIDDLLEKTAVFIGDDLCTDIAALDQGDKLDVLCKVSSATSDGWIKFYENWPEGRFPDTEAMINDMRETARRELASRA